eukprot:Rmarinus@m.657
MDGKLSIKLHNPVRPDQIITLEVNSGLNVLGLKRVIQESHPDNPPPESQRLVFAGALLSNEESLLSEVFPRDKYSYDSPLSVYLVVNIPTRAAQCTTSPYVHSPPLQYNSPIQTPPARPFVPPLSPLSPGHSTVHHAAATAVYSSPWYQQYHQLLQSQVHVQGQAHAHIHAQTQAQAHAQTHAHAHVHLLARAQAQMQQQPYQAQDQPEYAAAADAGDHDFPDHDAAGADNGVADAVGGGGGRGFQLALQLGLFVLILSEDRDTTSLATLLVVAFLVFLLQTGRLKFIQNFLERDRDAQGRATNPPGIVACFFYSMLPFWHPPLPPPPPDPQPQETPAEATPPPTQPSFNDLDNGAPGAGSRDSTHTIGVERGENIPEEAVENVIGERSSENSTLRRRLGTEERGDEK